MTENARDRERTRPGRHDDREGTMTQAPVQAQLVVGPAFVPTNSGYEPLTVTNPADQSVVGQAPIADAYLVDEAVAQAAQAFAPWSTTPAPQRAARLVAIAAWIRANSGRLARTLTLEQGKPIGEAVSEVGAAAQAFDYYAAEAVRVYGQVIPTASATVRSFVVRQPLGVVAAIATWNYPIGLMAWKIAPALAAGCTVVAKPAEETPLAVLDLVAGAVASGLPPGVLNSLNGEGASVGTLLAGHPKVSKISFTGGTVTGKQLLELAARDVKRVTLELGGHSPMIVAGDAPMDIAVTDGVKRSFRNAGQLCNSVNRIFVVRSVADEFVDKFAAHTARLVVGSGLDDPEPDVGPMSNERGRSRVEDHVEDARRRGAEVLVGGSRPEDERLSRGFYYLPTVVLGGDDMVMLREETFGPVAPILVVDDVDEAIQRANALEYGLVCYLYTRDLRTSLQGAERLEFGTVNVNNVGGGEVPFPYGGWKQSGLGLELSHQGLEEYLQTKHVRIETGYI
jgi:succinate-semialdehyde dehydrogenase / glutarate-semialdehyde dehydrogenase